MSNLKFSDNRIFLLFSWFCSSSVKRKRINEILKTTELLHFFQLGLVHLRKSITVNFNFLGPVYKKKRQLNVVTAPTTQEFD